MTLISSTFQNSTSVLSAVKCRLVSESPSSQTQTQTQTDTDNTQTHNATDTDTHLVLAKLHRIEIYTIGSRSKGSGGLEYVSAVEVRGKVRLVRVLRGGASSTGGDNDAEEGGRGREGEGGQDTRHDSDSDQILVLLDHPDPEILVLGAPGHGPGRRISILKTIPIQERGRRPGEFCMDLQVVRGTTRTTAICTAYAGVLHVVWIESGEVESVPLEGMMNLVGVGVGVGVGVSQQLWMIHLDRKERLKIVVKTLVVPLGGGLELLDGEGDGGKERDREITMAYKDMPLPEPDGQVFVVPVSGGGVVVLGGRRIMWYVLDRGRMKKRASVDWPWSTVVAWTEVEGNKFLVGDMYGRLALLVVDECPSLILIPLGSTSPPTTLLSLGSQYVFVGSHFGDSVVVRVGQVPRAVRGAGGLMGIPKSVRDEPITIRAFNDLSSTDRKRGGVIVCDEDTTFLETVGVVVKNIAPVRDALVVDEENHTIVTCSGGANQGSVNVLRLGADFTLEAEMTLGEHGGGGDVIDMWPLKVVFGDEHHRYLALSTILDTTLIELGGGGARMCSRDEHDLKLDYQTLYIGNITYKASQSQTYTPHSPLLIHLTPHSLSLLTHDPILNRLTLLHSIDATSLVGGSRGRFVRGSGGKTQVLVGQEGGWLGVWGVREENGGKEYKLVELVKTRKISLPSPVPWHTPELSAVHCPPTLDPAKYYTPLVVLAFWHTAQIGVYRFGVGGVGVEVVCATATTHVVRSLYMAFMTPNYKIEHPQSRLCVFAGMVNGEVGVYEVVVGSEPRMVLLDTVSLGGDVKFTMVDDIRILATGPHRSVLFSFQHSRIHHVNLPLVSPVCSVGRIQLPGFTNPASIILTSSSSSKPLQILIGSINSDEQVHIQSLSLPGFLPRQIAYLAGNGGVFGVAGTRVVPRRVGEGDEGVEVLQEEEEEEAEGEGRGGQLGRAMFVLLDSSSLQVLAQAHLSPNEQIMSLISLQGLQLFVLGTVFLPPTQDLDGDDGDLEPRSGRIILFRVSPSRTPASASQAQTRLEKVGEVKGERGDRGGNSDRSANDAKGKGKEKETRNRKEKAKAKGKGKPRAQKENKQGQGKQGKGRGGGGEEESVLIAAAINSSVTLFRISPASSSSSSSSSPNPSPTFTFTLTPISEWNHNYLVNSLSAYTTRQRQRQRQRLIVADQFSSVSVLEVVDVDRERNENEGYEEDEEDEYEDEEEEEDEESEEEEEEQVKLGQRPTAQEKKYKLVTVARDYSPLWPVCVEAGENVDEDGQETFVGADQSLNLFSFSLHTPPNNNNSNRINRRGPFLLRDGFYHLGDLVTKVIRVRAPRQLSTTTQTQTPSASASASLRTSASTQPPTSPSTNRSKFTPTHLYFTLSGQIGLLVRVGDERTENVLGAVERVFGRYEGEGAGEGAGEGVGEEGEQGEQGRDSKVRSKLKAVVVGGGTSHAKHRAPRLSSSSTSTTYNTFGNFGTFGAVGGRSDAEEGAYGFVDGDVLRRFLALVGQGEGGGGGQGQGQGQGGGEGEGIEDEGKHKGRDKDTARATEYDLDIGWDREDDREFGFHMDVDDDERGIPHPHPHSHPHSHSIAQKIFQDAMDSLSLKSSSSSSSSLDEQSSRTASTSRSGGGGYYTLGELKRDIEVLQSVMR
ncbi:mono-functional DNA-alkylating methyl methanesulfonate N-term-domain-containing protein [Lentinula raphanica]|nr:mono-functional DNA-alkylating methyl methanesulfonate N-term-domain-containing protein [Lentinula raphanica]